MLRRPCGRAMRSKGRVGVDAVASKPGVAKEVLPLTRRVLRLRLLKVGKLGEYDSLSHSRTEVRGRRGPRLNDRAPPRGSHTTLVWRSESSLHTMGPPVLLNSIIGTPGGRYMRLVTPLRAPFAAPIAPSYRGGLVHKPPPRQLDHPTYGAVARRLDQLYFAWVTLRPLSTRCELAPPTLPLGPAQLGRAPTAPAPAAPPLKRSRGAASFERGR